MVFDWILQSRTQRTNADLIVTISPKKPFSSVMRYIVLWRHSWRYRINTNIQTWYSQKSHILTITLIPSYFFSDHCVKLYGCMCITFQMPLVLTVGFCEDDFTLTANFADFNSKHRHRTIDLKGPICPSGVQFPILYYYFCRRQFFLFWISFKPCKM